MSSDTSPAAIEKGTAGLMTSDEEGLASLGYKQELRRELTSFSNLASSFSVIGILVGLSATLGTSIQSGGPSAAIFGWIAVWLLACCVAACMAEISSAFPTSGGPYYWSHSLAPIKYRLWISWFTAYANITGQIAVTAAIDYSLALFILAAAYVGSDGAFVITVPKTLGVYWASLIVQGLINTFGTRTIGYFNMVSVYWSVGGVLVIIVAILAKTENKHSASFAFGDFENLTGWSSANAWLLGLLQAAYTITGFDSSAHLSEETKNSAVAVPAGIFGSVFFAGFAGLVYLIPLMFCLGDVPDLVASASGEPIVQLFFNSVGKSGAIGLTVILIVSQFLTGLASVTANSRVVWSFSRDRGLPGSGWWMKVDQRVGVPVYALWLCILLEALIALIALGSTAAFTALTSVSTIALYLSYGIPTACLLFAGRRHEFRHGPFHLGKWSPVLGTISTIWILFITVLFCLPPANPVTPANMNYASVMISGVAVFSVVYWFAWGRKNFKGPGGAIKAAESSPDTISNGEDIVEPAKQGI